MIYFHLSKNERIVVHEKISDSWEANGSILIEGFGKDQVKNSSGGPKDPDMLYYLEELKQEFQGFQWIETFDGEVELHEGTGHAGIAHVIRLFGKKNNQNHIL